MKVKELVEKLQTLDQERNIWQFYDFPYDWYEPIIETVSEDDAKTVLDKMKKSGKYDAFKQYEEPYIPIEGDYVFPA